MLWFKEGLAGEVSGAAAEIMFSMVVVIVPLMVLVEVLWAAMNQETEES